MRNKEDKPSFHCLFKIISISLPLFFLVILELLLRLFHFGYSTDLFIENKDRPGFVHNNAEAGKQFFTSLNDAPASYVQHFKKKKDSGTFRIFVLGESTGIGFPYSHRASFSRMLNFWLDRTIPEIRFEIINLSVTAVNSYALLSYSKEIVKMNPDAILIYTGHNEYYGAMGIGSSNKYGNNRKLVKAIITLKKSRVIQLIFNPRKKNNTKKTGNNPGLMQKMAGEQEIVFESNVFVKGLNQFEQNMTELLEIFSRYNIPVFMSDIVCNIKDQKPFISKLNSSTDSSAYFNEYRQGLQAIRIHKYDSASIHLNKARKIDSTYAMNEYILGKLYYQSGNYSKANEYFNRAKELDLLRFRAPEKINKIISEICGRFENVKFVPVSEGFILNSPHGISGNELFIDHLHPNIRGYFLIAEAFYHSIINENLIGNINKKIPSAIIWDQLPVSEVDSVIGCLVIGQLKEKWPFYEHFEIDKNLTSNYPGNLALLIFMKKINWKQSMDSLYNYYLTQGNFNKALKVIKELEYEYPEKTIFTSEIGRIYQIMGNYKDAFFYYKKAYQIDKNLFWIKKIVMVLFQMNNLDEAKKYLIFIKQVDNSDNMSSTLLAEIESICELKKNLNNSPQNTIILNKLAKAYSNLGNKEISKQYITQSLLIDKNNFETKQLNLTLNKLR